MIKGWIQDKLIAFAIGFALRQLERFKGTIDWVKVRVDLELRVRDLMPGTWLDDEAVVVMNAALDVVIRALDSTAKLEQVLKLLADSQWDAALQKLKELILGAITPTTPAEAKVVAFIQSEQFLAA